MQGVVSRIAGKRLLSDLKYELSDYREANRQSKSNQSEQYKFHGF
jgi:hypothetical protein